MIDSVNITIWGREFVLPIEYNCYDGEVVLEEQVEALEAFLVHKEWIEKAKGCVEDYCREDVADDESNNKKNNIFSYIKPECIFVKRDKDNPRIALMCKYRYDLEHGLAVVFSSNGEVVVGIQDIIL